MENFEKYSQPTRNRYKRCKLITQKKIDDLEDKYGSIFDQFNRESIIQAGFYGVMGLRKILFASTLVYLNNFPIVDLIIFIILCTIMIFILIKYKPLKKKWLNNAYVITEFLFLILYCLCIFFIE